ncbi:MAG: NfeD family protein [Treponema sp.]|nr:NfeD family protein [Candidatus Treponema equi]
MFEITTFMSWVWVGILVVSIIVEASTMALTTIWAAIASIPLIFIARGSMPIKWQILIFIFLTAILAFLTRPFVVKFLRTGKQSEGNINSLDGQTVLCVSPISEFKFGEVKTKNGVVWTAKSEDGTEIPSDSVCTVSRVEGNTLVVKQNKKGE